MERLRDGKNSTVMHMTAEAFLKLKLLPRGMMIAMTVMSWRCAEWFMDLPPEAQTTGATAFVSVVMGAMTGSFGIWMNNEGKPHDTSSNRPGNGSS